MSLFGNQEDRAATDAKVVKALDTLTGEINLLSRQMTDIRINVMGLRRKLGFEESWAEWKHDEDYISALQDELRKKKEAEK